MATRSAITVTRLSLPSARPTRQRQRSSRSAVAAYLQWESPCLTWPITRPRATGSPTRSRAHKRPAPPGIAAECLEWLGAVAGPLDNEAEMRLYAEQALQQYQAIGDRRGTIRALMMLGEAEGAKDDLPAALAYIKQSLAMSREIGDRWIECTCCYNIGLLTYLCGWLTRMPRPISRRA